MSTPASGSGGYCTRCGASWKQGAAHCWMCQGAPPESVADAHMPRFAPPVEPSRPFQYSLGSLLLVMTLIAMVCSVTSIMPVAGIPLAVVTLAALARTCLRTLRGQAYGERLSFREQAATFLTTFGTIIAVPLAVVSAFAISFLTARGIGESLSGGTAFIVLSVLYGGAIALVDAAGIVSASSKGSSRR